MARKKLTESGRLLTEARRRQLDLKRLGVAPPPPAGKPADAAIMRPGRIYHPSGLSAQRAYLALLRATYERHAGSWKPAVHLHRLMSAALAAAPPHEHPPAPHHGGVPAQPQFTNPGYVAVAVYCAEAVAATLRPAERALYDGWLMTSRRFDGRGSLGKKPLAELGRSLTPPLPAKASRALRSAHFAAHITFAADRHGNGGDVATRRLVEETVQHLVAARVAATTFLRGLDETIVREDLRAALAKASKFRPSAPLAAALWRAADDGKTTHWLGRLADDTHVLLYKLGNRYQAVEGSRDEVLASVPDAHMASAVAAVR